MAVIASDTVVLAAADNWAATLERAVAAQEEGREGDDEGVALRDAILVLYSAVRGRRAHADAPGCRHVETTH